jgi:predicted RNase H-like HicB family nuclease
MTPIEGKYSFTITKEDGIYVAQLSGPNFEAAWTDGKNAEELFDNIADCYMTVYDVKVGWWHKLLWLLR